MGVYPCLDILKLELAHRTITCASCFGFGSNLLCQLGSVTVKSSSRGIWECKDSEEQQFEVNLELLLSSASISTSFALLVLLSVLPAVNKYKCFSLLQSFWEICGDPV